MSCTFTYKVTNNIIFCSLQAFDLISVNVVSTVGTLLSLMHSTSQSEVKLKSDVLDALLKVFDLDPKTREGFREVGGFVYVMSVLINMEGSLADPISSGWQNGED